MDSTHSKNVANMTDGCMGCGLCANLCPRDAISMVWGDAGFLIPGVDDARCVSCSLCVRNCPAQAESQHVSDSPEPEVWGAWNRNKQTRRSSSSGGIFSALAEWVISEQGCVYGVVWSKVDTASFTKAETPEEVLPMRGSKYTQAHPGMIYRDVKKELRQDRQVLFSGTPCQVHALKKYLGKEYEKLLTVDIVCHGVPSRKLLQKYIAEQSTDKKKIKHLHFRDKSTGWQGYSVRRTYDDGSEEKRHLSDDSYMRMFLSDTILNKSCYDCAYIQHPRQGDLTLGDFWGIERYHADWPLQDGVSLVLANTEKGKRILRKLEDALELHREQYAHLPHSGIKNSANFSPRRAEILRVLDSKPLSRVVEEVCDIRKIGPFRINRKWAMYQFLKRMKAFVQNLAK